MRFTNIDHKIQYDREQAEILRKELVILYKERDKIREEIADQRNGNVIVSQSTKNKKTELYWICRWSSF